MNARCALNEAGYIFAGTAVGVFRSINDAEGWSNVSSGLVPPGGNVWALAIDSEGFLFAGTGGAGRSAALIQQYHLLYRPGPAPPRILGQLRNRNR